VKVQWKTADISNSLDDRCQNKAAVVLSCYCCWCKSLFRRYRL